MSTVVEQSEPSRELRDASGLDRVDYVEPDRLSLATLALGQDRLAIMGKSWLLKIKPHRSDHDRGARRRLVSAR
jgi:hypothetical protein